MSFKIYLLTQAAIYSMFAQNCYRVFLKMTSSIKRREFNRFSEHRLYLLALLLPGRVPAPVVFRKR